MSGQRVASWPTVDVRAALFTGPPLPRALCKGQAPRWDSDPLAGEAEEDRVARLRAAQVTCQRCPELAGCPAPIRRIRPRSLPREG